MDYLLLSDSLFLFKLIYGLVDRCQDPGYSGADVERYLGVTDSCVTRLISADGKRDTDDIFDSLLKPLFTRMLYRRNGSFFDELSQTSSEWKQEQAASALNRKPSKHINQILNNLIKIIISDGFVNKIRI